MNDLSSNPRSLISKHLEQIGELKSQIAAATGEAQRLEDLAGAELQAQAALDAIVAQDAGRTEAWVRSGAVGAPPAPSTADLDKARRALEEAQHTAGAYRKAAAAARARQQEANVAANSHGQQARAVALQVLAEETEVLVQRFEAMLLETGRCRALLAAAEGVLRESGATAEATRINAVLRGQVVGRALGGYDALAGLNQDARQAWNTLLAALQVDASAELPPIEASIKRPVA